MAAKVGLTGGIGSGKSTVAKLFNAQGIPTIDADQVAKALSQPETDEFNRIVDYFGHSILLESGEINRKHLGNIVFSDSKKRKYLESILHPAIRRNMSEFSERSNSIYCILEIPLLVETDQWSDMDSVIVVTCSDEIRMKRLKQSRDLTELQIRRILATQISDKERCKHANHIISNDGTEDSLIHRVIEIHQSLTAQFSN